MTPIEDPITIYGLTAVPASASTLLKSTALSSDSFTPYTPVSKTPTPDTPLSKRIQTYTQSHLPIQTFNHSMRVYHYGLAIKQHYFPTWSFNDETYFLACMLHDIGTTGENLHKTRLSHEFYSGMLAMDVLQQDPSQESDSGSVAPLVQAESVAEAIIRHQDICQVGKITALCQLLQLATIFDNVGSHADLVHTSTIEDVTKAFPRLKWSSCFSATICKELSLKPWAHTTKLGEEGFHRSVAENQLMKPYE